ncbi:MAG: histone deacetylase [Lacibacter sp.]
MPSDTLYIAYDPVYKHPLPEAHRFPMLKYELIPEQLIHEGSITGNQLHRPRVCPDDFILTTHTQDYLNQLIELTLSPREQRKIGFDLSALLIERERTITQGTIDCAFAALDKGIAFNVAGGTHHAFADRGEGFCILNDFAVAANLLLAQGKAKQILIIDLDVHQGNGTAKIFEQQQRVFTFSMHGEHNYPFHKEKSDLDIPLKDGTNDHTYLTLLRHHLMLLMERVKPDFIFYLSGVDILETDKFGKLKISMEGCVQRDEIVFETAHRFQIPCVVAMGGGYSPKIQTIVEAHCNTFRTAIKIYNLTL